MEGGRVPSTAPLQIGRADGGGAWRYASISATDDAENGAPLALR
jgi:hypothetical protein